MYDLKFPENATPIWKFLQTNQNFLIVESQNVLSWAVISSLKCHLSPTSASNLTVL